MSHMSESFDPSTQESDSSYPNLNPEAPDFWDQWAKEYPITQTGLVDSLLEYREEQRKEKE